MARELPARTELQVPVALSPAGRRLYDEARLAAVARLAGGDEAHLEQQRFQVLAAITRLRLLACHPRLHDPGSAVPSSKLARFRELAADLKEGGHRALVFSQFTSHLALVRAALDADGIPYLYLDGATPAGQRDRLVARFQAGEGDLFLISLKAGGTGLNLTGADYVIHLDPWWNPAVEDQATDRAHRIGQTRPVTVYRLVSRGTIEEAIVALHAEKRDLVAGVLDGMDSAGKLSPEDLVALIRAGPEAAEEPEEDAPGGAELEPEGAEEPPPALPTPAALAGSSPAPAARCLELAARFEAHLGDELRRGSIRREATTRSYARAARRFLEFVAREDGGPSGLAASGFDGLARRYLHALETGSFRAPASEPIVARSALAWLGRLLAAEARRPPSAQA